MVDYIIDDIVCVDQAPDSAALALEEATPVATSTGAWDNSVSQELMEIAFEGGSAWLLKRILPNDKIRFWLYPKTCAFAELDIQGYTAEQVDFAVLGQTFTAKANRVRQTGTGAQAVISMRH